MHPTGPSARTPVWDDGVLLYVLENDAFRGELLRVGPGLVGYCELRVGRPLDPGHAGP